MADQPPLKINSAGVFNRAREGPLVACQLDEAEIAASGICPLSTPSGSSHTDLFVMRPTADILKEVGYKFTLVTI